MIKKPAIKTSRKAQIGGFLGGWIMKLFTATLRTDIKDLCKITENGQFTEPVIFALWHNRIFTLPAIFRRYCPWRSAVALISPSKDGSALESAFKVLDIGAARGSSSRGGAGAFIALRRALKKGHDTGITPDGPRGPKYIVKPGIIKLAQASGAPIVPLHLTFSKAWTLKSWDGFRIPYPFSKVSMTFGAPITIPRELDDTELTQHAEALQKILLEQAEHPL